MVNMAVKEVAKCKNMCKFHFHSISFHVFLYFYNVKDNAGVMFFPIVN